MATAEDIDSLLAAEKTIVGVTRWRPDPSHPERTKLVATLSMEDASIVVGQLELQAAATLHTAPQHGSIILLFEERPLQRMNLFPKNAHHNPQASRVPREHRGRSFLPGPCRFYPWSADRRWPRSKKDQLDTATLGAESLADFGEAFTWFLAQCHINGQLPLPPHEPRLIA